MELLPAIIFFAISMSVTPGPNNIMVMTSGLNYGVQKSMPLFLGICIGFPVMVIFVGLGVSVIFQLYPILFEIIKVLGIVYLLYLAFIIASSTSSFSDNESQPFTFFQGALFQWVNPKAWITATGAIAAYTSVSLDLYVQIFIISVTFLIVAFPCVGIWLIFGNRLRNLLRKNTHQTYFNYSMALLLFLSVLPVIADLIKKYI
jgi:threonine/homoserine/homoserine lactone efflux protein